MQRFLTLWRRLAPWVQAFRPPAQINLALPMLLGLAQAGAWTPHALLQALVISLLLQGMILYSNDASDASTDDPLQRTLISGGSGVGAQASVSPQALRWAAIAAGAVGLVVCLALQGLPLAGVWLVACALVWAYDGQTLRLSRHPLGSACQALGVGVVTPLLGRWLLAPPTVPSGVDLLIGLGLGFSGHVLSALPDEAPDRAVGKRTVVVRWGARRSFAMLLLGLVGAAGLMLGGRGAPGLMGWIGVTGLLAGVWWLRESVAAPNAHRYLARRPGKLTLEIGCAGLISVGLWVVWIAGANPPNALH